MMKYSHRVSDGVHVLSYVYLHQDTKISSARLASSIDSNPSLVRRLMSRLTKAGLLVTHPGTASPALAKEPEEITLLDSITSCTSMNKPTRIVRLVKTSRGS